ncbi:DUF5979 domain-containing protein [Brevibacterium mcbrellneri]|uniref:DUF5979 domain-containing protein n=1 Tax=Brevibacterium mcbrellneri TaxID=53363 RepID=UPI00145D48C0|nr:DUF5979 domain-containing protein [Brevibacterium mcbrellneri]
MISKVIALTCAMFMVTGMGVTAAQAADSFATEATVSNLHFVKESVEENKKAELSGEWSLPDNPGTPAGFTLALPEELQGNVDSFNLTSSDGSGEIVGQCKATATELTCTISDDYIKKNPIGLKGTFNFWVTVKVDVEEIEHKEFTFDNVEGKMPGIDVTPRKCTVGCDFTGQDSRKFGYYHNDGEFVSWWIDIEAPKEGMAGGEQIVVDDIIGPNQRIDADKIKVQKATEIYDAGDGKQTPHYTKDLPKSDFTVENDGAKVSWTAEKGAYYRINIPADTTDSGASGEYTNQAKVTVGTTTRTTEVVTVKRTGGGGTGIGTNVGRFDITKKIAGDAKIAADQAFTVNYTVTQPNGEKKTGTLTVKGGETVKSPEFPKDSTVHLDEVKPADSASVKWEKPKFSKNDFTLVGGTATAVDLTNTANLQKGKFSAKKAIEGTGKHRVDDSTTFTLNYSYPAGDGFEAGSGKLELPASGETVESDALPVGAELTLSEEAPAEIPGATWGEPQISPNTLTISADGTDATAVTVTNPITDNVGAFSVTKSLSGDGVDTVPEGTVFTVKYSYPADDSLGIKAGEGTVEVKAGDTAKVDNLPAGAKVTLTEVTAEDPDGAEWGEPVFDHSEFTVLKDNTVAINLDNPVHLRTAAFSLKKQLDGSGKELVDDNAVFTVEYSYPAGPGYDAGQGTLDLRADGSAVESPQLPVNAKIHLEEKTPEAVEGGSWTGHKFSDNDFALTDSADVSVVLTNTIDKPKEETPSTPPSTPSSPAPSTPGSTQPPKDSGDNLPRTGGAAWGVLGAGLALLVGGSALVLAMKRKRLN